MLRAPADEGFVRLNGAAHLLGRAGLHGEPDAVQHEPRGLLCDAERAGDLVAAHTVFAVGEHPQRAQPLVETDGLSSKVVRP
jgi:hypothetical protein